MKFLSLHPREHECMDRGDEVKREKDRVNFVRSSCNKQDYGYLLIPKS